MKSWRRDPDLVVPATEPLAITDVLWVSLLACNRLMQIKIRQQDRVYCFRTGGFRDFRPTTESPTECRRLRTSASRSAVRLIDVWLGLAGFATDDPSPEVRNSSTGL